VTSTLIGARSPEQVTDGAGALEKLSFVGDELQEIDRYVAEGGVNLWRQSPEIDASGDGDGPSSFHSSQ
jgi:L-glyceraldehyde 3-phosphate reductase